MNLLYDKKLDNLPTANDIILDEIVKEKSVLSRAMDLCFTVSAADPVKSKRIKAMCNTGLYMH